MDAKVMKRAVVVLLCLFVALTTTAWENVDIVSIMNIYNLIYNLISKSRDMW